MIARARNLWLNLSQGLAFVPGAIVAAFAALGIALVEIDRQIDLDGVALVFQGDGSAARTVLSVIAGSLITVAGLTFSITMVVLQLASSQFSPRVLRTFFGDRLTQVTIGAFVGIFVYAILVLRAVGSFDDAGFVPRLSVTVAAVLGMAAVVLLIVFLNHVSRMVQVSHVTSGIAQDTLARTDVLYPDGYGHAVTDERAGELLEAWRGQPAGAVEPPRPGYVQRVEVDQLADALGGRAERLAILVRPGDFVSLEQPVAEVWPREVAQECATAVRDGIVIAAERDLGQDVGFGVRQLADTALKALSPGTNDPMTAITCIGYLRSILVRLAGRADPPSVRRFPERELIVIAPQRRFDEHLEPLLQIGRYVKGDAWVATHLLEALHACAKVARRCGAPERLRLICGVAATVVDQASREAATERDRQAVIRCKAEIDATAAGAPLQFGPS